MEKGERHVDPSWRGELEAEDVAIGAAVDRERVRRERTLDQSGLRVAFVRFEGIAFGTAATTATTTATTAASPRRNATELDVGESALNLREDSRHRHREV